MADKKLMIRLIKSVMVLAIIASFAASIYFYPRMPDQIVSHWGASGEANGYMSKFWGLMITPLLSVGVLLLFLAIPYIDPLKANIRKFEHHYYWFAGIIMLFMFYLHILIIMWNLGARFSMPQLLAPAFGALLYYSGILIQNAKRNYSVGIRTPWTLASGKVWQKTHALGGHLFKACGVICLFGIFFEKIAFALVIGPILFVAVFLVVYSYVIYRKI